MKKSFLMLMAVSVLLSAGVLGMNEPGFSSNPVTIKVLSEEIDVDIPGRFKTIGKLFEKKYPNVKVEFILGEVTDVINKAMLDMAAGRRPAYDAVYCFIVTGELADHDYIIPLDEYFPKEIEELKAKLTPVTLTALFEYPQYYNGHVYGLPFSVLFEFCYYRTDLFKKAGLPGAPVTNEDFLEYLRKLKGVEPGVYPYVSDWNDDNLQENWVTYLDRFGGKMYNESRTKTAFYSIPGLNTLKFMKTLYDEELIAPDTLTIMSHEVKARIFQAGNAALTSNFPFLYSRLSDPARSQVVGKWTADLMWGNELYPSISRMTTLGLSVTKGSGHEREAFNFAKFLYSPEIQDLYGKAKDIPLTKEMYAKYRKGSEVLALAEKVMKTRLVPYFQTRHSVKVYKVLNQYIPPAIQGQISLKEALKKMSIDIDKILAKD